MAKGGKRVKKKRKETPDDGAQHTRKSGSEVLLILGQQQPENLKRHKEETTHNFDAKDQCNRGNRLKSKYVGRFNVGV